MNKYILIPIEKYQFLMSSSRGIHEPISAKVSEGIKEEPITHIPSSDGMTVERIVDLMPKNARNKARALLILLRDHIRWTNKGELIHDGQPIGGSHISDLVKYTVVKHFAKRPPKGSHEYFAILANINIPRSLIVNEVENQTPKQSSVTWHALSS